MSFKTVFNWLTIIPSRLADKLAFLSLNKIEISALIISPCSELGMERHRDKKLTAPKLALISVFQK